MSDNQEFNREQNEFIIEKIKERPINQKKLMRRTLITAGLAVLFGIIACVTILVLEPIINQWLYPEEGPIMVSFPEDPVEMSPEEMLSDTMQELQGGKKPQGPANDSEGKAQGGDTEALTQEDLTQTVESLIEDMSLDILNYRELYVAVAQYITELEHSMVTLTGITSNVDWLNNVMESTDQSTGIVIANNFRELLILADYRFVKRAEKLQVTFYDESKAEAYIKGFDKTTELCVIAVSLDGLTQECLDKITLVTLGSSKLRKMVGTPVVALGSPMGTNGSLAYGMIAGESVISEPDANYGIMQTDIYGSTSASGFLFNLQGHLVGVITDNGAAKDMKNLLSAYGISDLRKLIEKMSNGTVVPYLGVKGTDVSIDAYKELGVPLGAYITEVLMDSPAMKAGIQQGDVIVTVGGATITNFNEFVNGLMNAEAGKNVDIAFMRQSQGEYKKMTLSIVLGVSGKEE